MHLLSAWHYPRMPAIGCACLCRRYLPNFPIIDGANEIAFVNGTALINLADGQTEVHMALIHRGDADTDASLSLITSFLPSGSTVSSAQDTLAVSLDAAIEVIPNPSTT